MELASSGGTTPTKSTPARYSASTSRLPAERRQRGSHRFHPERRRAPRGGSVFQEIPAFTNGSVRAGLLHRHGALSRVVRATAEPSAARRHGSAGTPSTCRSQVSAGQTTTSVGAYNVCVSSSSCAVTSTTGTGGSGGGRAAAPPPAAPGRSHPVRRPAWSPARKEYIVQNNAWGSTAGQTITYGPGANFKVTVQKGTGADNNSRGFPSVFTGANSETTPARRACFRARSARSPGEHHDQHDLGRQRRPGELQRRL